MDVSTPEDVMTRLIEAVEVVAVTGKGDGPKTVLTAWPECQGKSSRWRRTFKPAQISRAEEALTWFALIDDTDARRALQFEVMCKAGGGKFSRICEKYGWKRSTVSSRNKVLLTRMAKQLNRAA